MREGEGGKRGGDDNERGRGGERGGEGKGEGEGERACGGKREAGKRAGKKSISTDLVSDAHMWTQHPSTGHSSPAYSRASPSSPRATFLLSASSDMQSHDSTRDATGNGG